MSFERRYGQLPPVPEDALPPECPRCGSRDVEVHPDNVVDGRVERPGFCVCLNCGYSGAETT